MATWERLWAAVGAKVSDAWWMVTHALERWGVPPAYVFLGLALLFVALGVWVVVRPPGVLDVKDFYETDDPEIRARLEEISFLWSGREPQRRKVALKELSKLWAKPELMAEVEPDPELRNPILQEFFEQHVKRAAYFRGAINQRRVVCEILKLLDEEGNGPSVVRLGGRLGGKRRDPEVSNMPDHVFSLLSQVPLAAHSVHVAEHVIAQLTAEGARHVIPDAMIAALSHDLGKIPSLRDELEATGNHALVAGYIERIEGFDALKHKDIILEAIKRHHERPEDRIGRLVAAAERLAREEEELFVRRHAADFAPPEEEERSGEVGEAVCAVPAEPGTQAREEGGAADSTVPEAAQGRAPEVGDAARDGAGCEEALWVEGSGYEVQGDPLKLLALVGADPAGGAREQSAVERRAESDCAGGGPGAAGPGPSADKARTERPAPLAKPLKGMPLPTEFLKEESRRTERAAPSLRLEREDRGADNIEVVRDFDAWFDGEALLDEIGQAANIVMGRHVNVLVREGEGVFVLVRFLDQVLREMALRKGYAEVERFPANSHPMRALLLRTADWLRARKLVHEGYVRPDAFGAPFRVIYKNQKQTAGLFLVLHQAAIEGRVAPETLAKRAKERDYRRIVAVVSADPAQEAPEGDDEGPPGGAEGA